MSHFRAPDNPLTNEKSRASPHAFPLTSGKPWEPARGGGWGGRGALPDPCRALGPERGTACAGFAVHCETPCLGLSSQPCILNANHPMAGDAAQLAERLPGMHKALAPSLAPDRQTVVAHACPVSPALSGWRQEDQRFWVILGCRVSQTPS